MQSSTDDMQDLMDMIKRKRASVATVQDLIRYALAHGMEVSELTSSGVQLR